MQPADDRQDALATVAGSPLLSAPPTIAGTARSTTVVAPLAAAGCAFAFAHGREALVAELAGTCFGAAGHDRVAGAAWQFPDPGPGPAGAAPDDAHPTLPDVIGRTETGDRRVLFLCVPARLAWFDGHFPGDPILPAIVQVDWAIHFGGGAGGARDRFAGFSRLKFCSVIAPDTVLRLILSRSAGTLQFVYESNGGVHSTGRIRFHVDADRG